MVTVATRRWGKVHSETFQNPSDGLYFVPTILRTAGFEFIVFPNDHVPAHVHAFHGDDVVVIDVSGERPVVRQIIKMKPTNVRRAVEAASTNLDALRRGWMTIHGPRLR